MGAVPSNQNKGGRNSGDAPQKWSSVEVPIETPEDPRVQHDEERVLPVTSKVPSSIMW